MRVSKIILIAGFFVATVSAAQRFDLKGDVLGESVATYRSRHPNAKCQSSSTPSTALVTCKEIDTSFAGHESFIDNPSCYPHDAIFFRNRLQFIKYCVSGMRGTDVIDALSKKYGKPNMALAGYEYHKARWEDSTSYLEVTVDEERDVRGEHFLESITIILADKDQQNDKDI